MRRFEAMTSEVACARELNQTTVAPLVAAIVGADAGAGDDVLLNLDRLCFAHPFPLTVLSSLLESHTVGTGSVSIRCPSDPNACRYLAAAGFIQEICEYVTVEGDQGLRRKRRSWGANTVLPLTKLLQDTEIQEVLEQIDRRLKSLLKPGEARRNAVLASVRSTVREMCVNIFQHAACQTGWIAAQQYVNRYDGMPYVEIGVADAGRGIRASLATAYPELREATEMTAIREALSGRSRRQDPTSGTGFFVLQRAADQLDGQFYLRSGRGAVMRPRRGGLHLSTAESPWQGTHLKVVVTCG